MVGEQAHKEFLLGKHEVKTDYKTQETNNFYIEYAQDNGSGWRDSGINVTHSEWWVFASPTGEGLVAIRTNSLRTLLASKQYPVREQPIRDENTNRSVGYLVPSGDVYDYLKLKGKERYGKESPENHVSWSSNQPA